MAPLANSASVINEPSLDELTAFAFQFFVQTLTAPSLLSTNQSDQKKMFGFHTGY